MCLNHSVDSGLRHSFPVFIFELVLSLDLGGNNFGQGKCEDSLVLGQEEHDPEVAELAVGNFPFFGIEIPSVAASDTSSNFFVCEGRGPLFLGGKTSATDCFLKHVLDYTIFNRQLFALDVFPKFNERDFIVVVLIHSIAESDDALFGNLHRHRPLL